MLYGRAAEIAEVESLVAGARAGSGGAAIIRGEAGIGKTALLRHAADAADGALLLRCAGSALEEEQPFAFLELMLRPVRDRFGDLPAADAERLRAIGEPRGVGEWRGVGESRAARSRPEGERRAAGEPRVVGREGPFGVGRALLGLLRRVAAERPVLCLVDDAQWLDAASVAVLAFTARRLGGEPVALLAAVRGEEAFGSSGLPEIRPRRLAPDDAAALMRGGGEDLSPPARERVLAEAGGNPLALRLLPASLSPAQRAGRINPITFHDGTTPLAGTFQTRVSARLAAMAPAARVILLAAAADDTGDCARISAAAGRLGATVADLAPAERAGLLEAAGMTVRFTHPLVRAAVYHRATTSERRSVHRALAEFSGREQAERRAWHMAAAAAGPSEHVAAELERAGRRSDAARAYACLARAAELTPGGAARVNRLAAAARSAAEAGLFGGAAELAASAAGLAAGPRSRAALAQAEAAAEFERGSPRGACRTLLDGAAPIGGSDPVEALLMLADAVRCGWHAGDPRLVREALDAMASVPVAGDSPLAALPRALVASASPGGAGEAVVTLIGAARRSLPDETGRRLAASLIALADGAHEAAADLVRDCRDSGGAGPLPYALQSLAHAQIMRGRLREARETAAEGLRLAETGSRHRAGHLRCLLGWLAAVEGDEERCAALVAAGTEHAAREGITPTVALGTWALALLDLGHGRNEDALARLEDVPDGVPEAGPMADVVRQASDRVEAAVRCGRPERAEPSLARLERWAERNPSPVTVAILKRCRALLNSGRKAERNFSEAVALLCRESDSPYEEARTELLYGEWLRRERRRAHAREHLSRAMDLFDTQGALIWARRARAELGAAGARQAGGAPEGNGTGGLTHQELQIVRLAAAGASNREIAARLYLSPRTVGNHLYRAYPKLGVRTRVELRGLDLDVAARGRHRPAPD
ncbi:AAA family ATPase [Actinomadura sp. 3N407]|uniref:helix-turn-helix transcriptional regulator n=1 Tax=Actinomadura sp. 3N407 TaxID=3457423 RepID=UPI003FCD2F89